MAAIEVSGLVKAFGERRALEGVDLTVAEGEVRGLLGPNGAGKTTLLRILMGLVRSDGGTVELLGRSPEATLDGVGGFVEEPRFYPYLSARANLEVLARLDGASSASRIDEVLSLLELQGRAEDRVSGYSSGMRQRLGIAAALMRSPRLLLLDEPTTGLDPAGIRSVSSLLRSLAADGVTVLLSSHQIGEVEEVCDGFDVLSGGRVVWSGSVREMLLQAPPSPYWLTTSDDGRARTLAGERAGLELGPKDASSGLRLRASAEAMDSFVLALAEAGVAVRGLEQAMSPLESMFFALTGEEPGR